MSKRTLLYRAKLYNETAERMPIKHKTIYYHAYRSYIMSCSPFAIFSNLIADERYADYEHIWVYGSEEVLEYDTFKRYGDHPNVRLVEFGSPEHIEVLATSEYLITNAGIPSYWQKREGQTVINTWHGVPLKMLGKDAKDSDGSSIGNAQRNFLLSDYLVMPNRYTAEKIIGSYDLKDLIRGKVLDVGSPRVDMVINTDPSRIRSMLEDKLGDSLEGKKVVLYAPTFRSSGGKSVDTVMEMADYMTELVDRLPEDYVIFFKVHNMLGKFFDEESIMQNRLIFDEFETNELLSATDVLITDYSSIFVDFICTERPVIFFAYDKEEYLADRGTYLDMDQLPGTECATVDDVLECILADKRGEYVNPNRDFAFETFAYNDDGNATQRVVDIIFHGQECPQPDWLEEVAGGSSKKENILISLDDSPKMSAVQSLLMLLRGLDQDKYRVVVAVHNFNLFIKEAERIFPDIRTIFAHMLYERAWCSGELGEDFYRGQFDNYFPGMKFSRFYNLKRWTGFLDVMVDFALPSAEKHWHFNWFAEINAESIGERIPRYDEVTIYCSETDEIPETLLEPHVTVMSPRELRADERHPMTVLLIATFDSSNYALAQCAKELVARGHQAIIISSNPVSSNNRMFREQGLKVISSKSMDVGAFNYVDLVIGSSVKPGSLERIYRIIMLRDIVMLCFSNLFTNVSMRVYPHFVLTLGEEKNKEFQDYLLQYNCVAIGNPQYDSLLENRRDYQIDSIKSVLVVEQGGYPYGAVGKRQLAETLIGIAKDNPDITFDIKPRYMPGGFGSIHSVSDHLFDYLEDAPENLQLLTVEETLEDCILRYDAMITMWSTAHLDAVVLNMPLLLIGGLDSIDVFDVRSYRVGEAYQRLEKTGCIWHYSELRGDIKDKFRLVDDSYAKSEIYEIEQPCAPRVVNFIEHAYDSLVIPEKRIANRFMLTEQGYYDDFPTFDLVDAFDEEYIVRRRYLNMLNARLQEFTYKNRCMANVLDLSPLQELYDFDLSGIGIDDVAEFNAMMRELLGDSFALIQKAFFESEDGMRQVEQDLILQDFYFDWLYRMERYDEIEHPVIKNVLASETRYYWLARMALDNHQVLKAYDYLFEFLRIASSRETNQLLKCKRLKRSLAPFRRGLRRKLLFFRWMFASENSRTVEYVFPRTERVPLVACRAARLLNKEGYYDECVSLCVRTRRRMRVKGKRRSTVTGTVKLYFGKAIYRMILREQRIASAARNA